MMQELTIRDLTVAIVALPLVVVAWLSIIYLLLRIFWPIISYLTAKEK